MNVSSIVVKTSSENLQVVAELINSIKDCETHFSDPSGKIVVTIEGETIDSQMIVMKKIINIPEVYGANLAYSYCENEVTGSLDRIGSQLPDLQ